MARMAFLASSFVAPEVRINTASADPMALSVDAAMDSPTWTSLITRCGSLSP